MSTGVKRVAAVSVILILAIHLLLLYYLKYNNQSLLFSDFSILNTGNILNLIFFSILILGILISSFRKEENLKPAILVVFTLTLSLLLLLCLIVSLVKLPANNIYIFDQALNKFIVAFFFASYQFVLFMFISTIWLRLFSTKDLIFFRAFINSVIIVIILLLFAYFYMEIRMNGYYKNPEKANASNVAVVLGAAVWSNNKPSPTLASRIDKAVRLYKSRIVNKIQLTGSNAPGELSEAEVALNYILKKGVDSSDILIEKITTSTTEQIKFIKQELITGNDFDNIYIVSDKYHLVRVQEISNFYDLDVNIVASELKLSFYNRLYYRMRECIALVVFWFFAL
jgi:vancomycin permeability regulator SanA